MTPKRNEKVTDANEAIRQYYEEGTPLESEGSRDGTEPVSTPDELAGKPDRPDEETTRLSGGDVDASTQGVDTGTEAAGGSNPLPDQDVVDEIGRAAGITYQDNEPLKFGEKATTIATMMTIARMIHSTDTTPRSSRIRDMNRSFR